jgi:glutathione-regulated potassium-efflux system ancillary protein KefF
MVSPSTPPAAASADAPGRPAGDAASRGDEVLVIAAHPQLEQSRVNRRLMRRIARDGRRDGPRGQGGDGAPPLGRVHLRDLYGLYPDYLIDAADEQAALARARLVVWLHPIQWYAMPPLMKLWLDEVLAFGWAYGPGGDALRGKDLWLVTSTGGTESSYRPDGYNRYFFDAFLPPYEQTAALCGMRFLPPMVLHGAHRASEEELAVHEDVFAQRLASYPDWPELADLGECIACEVPRDARPAAGAA